jgi:hypothetical protein
VFVVTGYDAAALEALSGAELGDVGLVDAGAAPGSITGLFRLAYSATPADVATPVHSPTGA